MGAPVSAYLDVSPCFLPNDNFSTNNGDICPLFQDTYGFGLPFAISVSASTHIQTKVIVFQSKHVVIVIVFPCFSECGDREW
jgi:hypothetical protein